MPNAQTYSGGCHCGQVRYQVTADLGSPVLACNCSICNKKGTLLAFVPADQLSLRSGEEALTSYRFGKKAIDHLFCSTCGISSFARGTAPDGRAMVAVNVRCLDGVDVGELTINHFDGKSL